MALIVFLVTRTKDPNGIVSTCTLVNSNPKNVKSHAPHFQFEHCCRFQIDEGGENSANIM